MQQWRAVVREHPFHVVSVAFDKAGVRLASDYARFATQVDAAKFTEDLAAILLADAKAEGDDQMYAIITTGHKNGKLPKNEASDDELLADIVVLDTRYQAMDGTVEAAITASLAVEPLKFLFPNAKQGKAGEAKPVKAKVAKKVAKKPVKAIEVKAENAPKPKMRPKRVVKAPEADLAGRQDALKRIEERAKARRAPKAVAAKAEQPEAVAEPSMAMVVGKRPRRKPVAK